MGVRAMSKYPGASAGSSNRTLRSKYLRRICAALSPRGEAGDDGGELGRFDRLGDVGLVSGPQRTGAVLGAGKRGECSSRRAAAGFGRQRADLADEVVAVLLGH